MADNTVLVIEAVIGTGIICAVEESVHFVLVEIYHAYIAVVVLIIDVICAAFAVCGLLFVHRVHLL